MLMQLGALANKPGRLAKNVVREGGSGVVLFSRLAVEGHPRGIGMLLVDRIEVDRLQHHR